jgi:hypothetical protein
MTDTAGLYLHQDFILLQFVELDLLNRKLALWFPDNSCCGCDHAAQFT